MISSDREILLSINDRLVRLEGEQARQREEFSEFKATVLHRLDGIDTELTIIKHDQASLQTSIYWGFALMGLIVGVFTLWLSTPKAKPQEPASTPQVVVQLPPYPYRIEHDEKSA